MSSKAMLSKERVEDSSDEGSSGSEVESKPKQSSASVKKGSMTNSLSRKAIANGLSNSNSEDSDEGSDRSGTSSSSSTSTQSSKRKAAQQPTETTSSPAKKAKMTSTTPSSQKNNTNTHDLANVKRVESTKYTPPQGYTANKPQPSDTSSQAQQHFANLDSRQVWHISAPASFPMSKLESLDLQAALKGDSILQHKGTNYRIISEGAGTAALLTAKPNGDYVRAAPITRTLRIIGTTEPTNQSGNATTNGEGSSQQQGGDRSTAITSPTTFFATQPGQKKIPRKQPDNLKARYIPYGVVKEPSFEDQAAGIDEDVIMTDASVLATRPKLSSEVDVQATPKPSKKANTKKIAISSQTDNEEQEESPVKRKKVKKDVSTTQVDDLMGSQSSQKREKKEKRRKEKA